MFGLTFDKVIVLGILAAFVIGPNRLPDAAEWLAHAVKRVRAFGSEMKERVADEMGPDFDDVDWHKLDPRQYDPRQIVRQALLDDAPAPLPSRVPRSELPSSPSPQKDGEQDP